MYDILLISKDLYIGALFGKKNKWLISYAYSLVKLI